MYEFDANKSDFCDKNNEGVTNLHYPEIERIDYSEYSNEKFFKNDFFSKKPPFFEGFSEKKLWINKKNRNSLKNMSGFIEPPHFVH